MKNILIILFTALSVTVWAQDFDEQIAVPLSSPGSKGKLAVGQVRGNIIITAYDGNEVIIQATAKTGKECDDCEEKAVPQGMKRISSSPVELSASEKDNRVKIETNSWKKPINLTIKLPANFDLDVSTVHGKIEVTGINGTHEISSVNGPLTLKDMSGSIVSNTVNGDIIVNFKRVEANEPMSFVTLNGNVDVTFPSGIKATAKMRSDRGEIYTDFEMTVDRSKPEVKTGNDNDYKISVNSWVFGKINGGGPEYTFKNMNGNIMIREE